MPIHAHARVSVNCDNPKCGKEVRQLIEKESHIFNNNGWQPSTFGRQLEKNGWFAKKGLGVYCPACVKEMVQTYKIFLTTAVHIKAPCVPHGFKLELVSVFPLGD